MLVKKWFPGRGADEESMGEALYLETDFWEKLEIIVANGVSRAFNG